MKNYWLPLIIGSLAIITGCEQNGNDAERSMNRNYLMQAPSSEERKIEILRMLGGEEPKLITNSP